MVVLQNDAKTAAAVWRAGGTICIAQVKLAVVFACGLTRQSSLRFAKSRQESTSARQFLTCRLDSVAENTWRGGGRGGRKSENKNGGQRGKRDLLWRHLISCGAAGNPSEKHTLESTGGHFPAGSTFCSQGLGGACVQGEYLHYEASWRQSPLWGPWADPGSRRTRWWRAPRWPPASSQCEGLWRRWAGSTGPAGSLTKKNPAKKHIRGLNHDLIIGMNHGPRRCAPKSQHLAFCSGITKQAH